MRKTIYSKIRKFIARPLKFLLDILLFSTLLLLLLFFYFPLKYKGKHAPRKKPSLLWGTTPLKSLSYCSEALKQAGYQSSTVITESSSIYQNKDFDYMLSFKKISRFSEFLNHFPYYGFFFYSLFRYDIYHYFFDGGLLKSTRFANFELPLLKIFNKKIILMPYGSDTFVFDLIPNPLWRHALLTHYPMLADKADKIEKRTRYYSKHADIVLGCLVHYVNLPRWDVLPLTCYPIDTKKLTSVNYPSVEGPIIVTHCPNHRGVKGTEFLLDAVERLKIEGYELELDIIERTPNHEALERIKKSHIFVDQLVFGYALAALEAMSFGKVVITGIDNTPEYEIFRKYSYLDECPAISANIGNIYSVLKGLLDRKEFLPEIAKKTREYVVNRHSYDACQDMFKSIYDKIWNGKNIDLINFYHPLKKYTVK